MTDCSEDLDSEREGCGRDVLEADGRSEVAIGLIGCGMDSPGGIEGGSSEEGDDF